MEDALQRHDRGRLGVARLRLEGVGRHAPVPTEGGGAGSADVVADRHASPTPTAHRQTLEERRPFSRWTMPPIGAAGLRIVVQTTEVLLVLGPGDVARVRVADQRMPLLARELHTPLGAMRRSARLGLSKDESAGIARVLERAQGPPVQGLLFPRQFALVRPGAQPAWEQQPLLAEAAHRARRRTSPAEGLEERAQGSLDLEIGIQHHLAGGVMDKTDR